MRRGAIAAAAVLAVVVIVGVLVFVMNSGSGGSKSSGSQSASAKQAAQTASASKKGKGKSKAPAAVSPSAVTVAVLNGTSTTNLAHDVSSKLQTAGFKPGQIATAADQTQSSTIVGYLPNDKRDALAVAKSLKLGPASVQAVDPNDRSVACNGSSTSCAAQVVVTVGSDLASNA